MLEMKRKVCFVGDEGVGKTCLIRRFAYNEFEEAYIRTVGTMVSKREIELPERERRVTLMVWDIMGQRRFMDLFKEAYFNHVRGVAAVFDMTRPETLGSLDEWLGCVRSSVGKVPTVVMANKVDLGRADRSHDENIQRFCDSHGLLFLKTSAKTGENVEEAIGYLAREMVAREEESDIPASHLSPQIVSCSHRGRRTA